MSVLEQNRRRKALLGQDGSSLTMLLITIAVTFVILNIIKVLYLINNSTVPVFLTEVVSWIAVPAKADVFITRPWTLATYMFSHVSLLHLISSLLWLWSFGFILQDFRGNKGLVPLFIYGGLAGAVTFIISVHLVPALEDNIRNIPPLLGAGPSLMAVAIGTTFLAPRYKIFPMINGGIPLWVLTIVFVLIHVGTVGTGNIGSGFALVAGGVIGYLYSWQLKRGKDMGQWMTDTVDWADDLFNPEKKHTKKLAKQQLFYKATTKPFEKTPHLTQERVDELLDKINQRGYSSLTDEEKEFLKKASQEEL